jgi:hypothetical protein
MQEDERAAWDDLLPENPSQALLRLVWWRCQALLAAGGEGRSLDALLLALAVDTTPRSREVVVSEVERVCVMIRATEADLSALRN